MATSLLKSFIEVVNPVVGQAAKKACDPPGHKTDRKMRSQMAQSLPQANPTSKSVLEIQLTNVDQPNDDAGQETMWDQAVQGENVLEVSGEEIPSLELTDQIAVHKHIPVMEPSSMSVNTSSMSMSTSAQQSQCEMEESGSEHGDMIQDAQLFKIQPWSIKWLINL